MEDSCSIDKDGEEEQGGREGNGWFRIQAHHIYCVLYFYYYYISPHLMGCQTLDTGGWGPLT